MGNEKHALNVRHGDEAKVTMGASHVTSCTSHSELIILMVGHATQQKQNFTDGSQMLKNHTDGQHF